MVQDTEKFYDVNAADLNLFEAYDDLVIMWLKDKEFWEDKLELICSLSVNYESALLYGKKVQHCQNNAYILKQGSTFLFYSESKLVSGLMFLFSTVFHRTDSEKINSYKPRFLELLVDIVPDQTINNLLKAFRDA